MILCGVVAYPISKILDWVLGPEQEVRSIRSKPSLEHQIGYRISFLKDDFS